MLRTLLARWKRKLLQKPFLQDPKYPAYWIDQVLGGKAAQVVQIGSNDGKTGDLLYALFQKNTQWQGLLVEPIPYLFERLRANYPDGKRFQLVQAAINTGQPQPFYWVDPQAKSVFPDLPYWFDQLGSFSEDHIRTELGERIEPFVRSQILEGLTLPDLLERYAIERIDVLHIDAEGYDWKILQQLDLQRFQPFFILFEYSHLSAQARKASQVMLGQQYLLYNVGIDILAVHRALPAAMLQQLGQHLQPFVS
ncbi:MAG: FkbM family methyltransferase [Bacteroidetes bacterium]|nr:MAG: FkbM family methyltransferase [Bacteroidota bacterium]